MPPPRLNEDVLQLVLSELISDYQANPFEHLRTLHSLCLVDRKFNAAMRSQLDLCVILQPGRPMRGYSATDHRVIHLAGLDGPSWASITSFIMRIQPRLKTVLLDGVNSRATSGEATSEANTSEPRDEMAAAWSASFQTVETAIVLAPLGESFSTSLGLAFRIGEHLATGQNLRRLAVYGAAPADLPKLDSLQDLVLGWHSNRLPGINAIFACDFKMKFPSLLRLTIVSGRRGGITGHVSMPLQMKKTVARTDHWSHVALSDFTLDLEDEEFREWFRQASLSGKIWEVGGAGRSWADASDAEIRAEAESYRISAYRDLQAFLRLTKRQTTRDGLDG